MRWRTAHARRKSWLRRQPVCCPKHKLPFQGDGWHDDYTRRFVCPIRTCREARFLRFGERLWFA